MFFKISSLKNFTIFTRKHMCWDVFLIKLPSDMVLFKKEGQTQVISVDIVKFLTAAFFKKTSIA